MLSRILDFTNSLESVVVLFLSWTVICTVLLVVGQQWTSWSPSVAFSHCMQSVVQPPSAVTVCGQKAVVGWTNWIKCSIMINKWVTKKRLGVLVRNLFTVSCRKASVLLVRHPSPLCTPFLLKIFPHVVSQLCWRVPSNASLQKLP